VGLWIAGSLISDVTRVGGAAARGGKKAYRKTKRAVKGSQAPIAGLTGFLVTGGLVFAAYWVYTQYQSGLGAYMPQQFVDPQILTAPGESAQVQIPAGW